MGVLHDAALENLLDRLHAASDDQVGALKHYYDAFAAEQPPPDAAARTKAFLSDKLVALDRDKAEFCYQLCRANQVRKVVEIGTSYGVSTLYLAAAIRDNLRVAGGEGFVLGTEYEPEKANIARAHFAQAGLSAFIELREGDLLDTLKTIDGMVDFLLVDIWTRMARPALELVAPHLRQGAVVICDNTQLHQDAYADYFAFLNDPTNGFRTMTLPFRGGLELSVRCRPEPSRQRWASPTADPATAKEDA